MQYLTHRTIRKREALFLREVHVAHTQEISKNDPHVVESLTNKAFTNYRDRNDIKEALGILCGLHGVDDSRGSLLLSLGFPDTVPFFSEALYKWLNWNRITGWNSEVYKEILQRVESLKKRFLEYGLTVGAVDIEKVAFVLEYETAIRGDLLLQVIVWHHTTINAVCSSEKRGPIRFTYSLSYHHPSSSQFSVL